jgi:hypothetical protein
MRVKHLATKSTMVKTSATSWVRSTITKKEMEKATADGLIAAQDSIKFPSTERIPKPPSGSRVMFLAFLLRGFSLPAHEFLCGLLFVYGVQLHRLTPNSLLHIACFVTLCESFLTHSFPQVLMKKFIALGTECAGYLKVAKASEGANLMSSHYFSSEFYPSISI